MVRPKATRIRIATGQEVIRLDFGVVFISQPVLIVVVHHDATPVPSTKLPRVRVTITKSRTIE